MSGDLEDLRPGSDRRPSLGLIVGLLAAVWGAIVASFPLNDNSFFTHLATGRLILDEGAIPSTDPYTFTAPGMDWTVQSWLPSIAYAAAERVGDVAGLRLLAVVVFVTASSLVWRLSRPTTSALPRVLLVSVVLFVVTPYWDMRPLMIGFVGMAVVILALDGAIRPVWLLPLMWFWANSHGSYPLALAVAVLTIIGRWLDGEPTDPAVRVLGHLALGSVLAVAGPLGLEVLTFPLTALTRSDLLGEVTEWQSPSFRGPAERAFLVLLVGTMLALVKRRRWADALPAAAFVAAALVAQRNIVMAAVVVLPIVAKALPSVGTLRSESRPQLGRPFLAVTGATLLLVVIVAVGAPARATGTYPASALAWLDSSRTQPVRVATEIPTGNLLEVLDGPTGEVFFDDRFDMFPDAIFDDALALTRGQMTWPAVLDRHDIDIVVWKRSATLGSILAASPAWRLLYSDSSWTVACRRGDGCGSLS